MVSTHFSFSSCPFPRLLNSFFFVTESCGDTLGAIFSTSPAALTTEARSLTGTSPPPLPPSNSGAQPPTAPSSSSSGARGPPHRHGRPYLALSCVTTFGDAVETCKAKVRRSWRRSRGGRHTLRIRGICRLIWGVGHRAWVGRWMRFEFFYRYLWISLLSRSLRVSSIVLISIARLFSPWRTCVSFGEDKFWKNWHIT